MTTDTTGTGDLIKRLRRAADEIADEGHYGWGPTCNDAADALEAAACPIGLDKTPDLCSAGTCHHCLGVRLGALADALEAAERVIMPFANAADEWDDVGPGRGLSGGDALNVGHLRAARDWRVRHATGQRKGEDDDS